MLVIRVSQQRAVGNDGRQGPFRQIGRGAEPCLEALDLLGWRHWPGQQTVALNRSGFAGGSNF